MRDLNIGRDLVIPSHEITQRFARAGGPGGQNVNKRDTKVDVLFDLDGSESLSADQKRRVRRALKTRIDAAGVLRVSASAHRTQAQNRERALDRMEELLKEALAPPPPPRVKTRPSRAAKERRIQDKKRRGEIKRLRRAAE
ncbi:MAG TPA: alternative ribosome rescue aminoacyl-tRNA hydrolase ArfB [Actinomycetota bacterium]|nr:alternative ribosome rescue aminoacyl-tRNA hydrolase ArfB [Actinomycetota bacterium]